MTDKYKVDPDAYKRSQKRLKESPELKARYRYYEDAIKDQPTFDTEEEAVAFALEKTKKGEDWSVWVAPKELGGEWKAISYKAHGGRGPEAADQLGWSMIYDSDKLWTKAHKDIDNIDEV